MRKKCPYSVRMRENTNQNNSEYGRFLRKAISTNKYIFFKFTDFFQTALYI